MLTELGLKFKIYTLFKPWSIINGITEKAKANIVFMIFVGNLRFE
jgi:hypothetical protein